MDAELHCCSSATKVLVWALLERGLLLVRVHVVLAEQEASVVGCCFSYISCFRYTRLVNHTS